MIKSSTQQERRMDERVTVNGEVHYSDANNEEFRAAILENFSEQGMKLLVMDRLEVGNKIRIQVQPDESCQDEKPLLITVEVVRIEEPEDIELYGYGCRIVDHNLCH